MKVHRTSRNFFLLAISIFVICICIYFYAVNDNIQTLEFESLEHGLTISCTDGRLGNQMFVYATLFAVSTLNKRRGQVPECCSKYLTPIFDLTLPTVTDMPSTLKRIEYPLYYNLTRDQMVNVPSEANIITGQRYKNSIRFFEDARSAVLQEFRFKKELVAYATNFLHRLGNANVFVGVHVRRGDYVKGYLKKVNLQEANVTFFDRAFDYYRNKYRKVIFVVISDDIAWCQKHFQKSDTHFQTKKHSTPGEDMALMAHCNHSIIDYGTFGWWGALLAGGETVYLANQPIEGPSTGRNEFYLEEWVGISQNKSAVTFE